MATHTQTNHVGYMCVHVVHVYQYIGFRMGPVWVNYISMPSTHPEAYLYVYVRTFQAQVHVNVVERLHAQP